jgi:hypothetical protein
MFAIVMNLMPTGLLLLAMIGVTLFTIVQYCEKSYGHTHVVDLYYQGDRDYCDVCSEDDNKFTD